MSRPEESSGGGQEEVKSVTRTPGEGDTPPPPPLNRRYRKRVVKVVAGLVLAYLIVAYLTLPFLWRRYARRHPALDSVPGMTRTGSGILGDALNVGLVGSETALKKIMLAAGWFPADALTLRSCLHIASATVLKRRYDDAPVSNLYLWDRKEDLAFERPLGADPRRRHHVRFWRAETLDADGRPLWMGAATFDVRVGLSETTGQITHHTAADIDAERATLFADLQKTGDLADTSFVDGFHKNLKGRNGGGDPWFTDGRLEMGWIGTP